MTKLSKKKVTDLLVDMTVEYTDMYFRVHKKKEMDKQIWSGLHMGFFQAMVATGYEEKFLFEALESAQKKLSEL